MGWASRRRSPPRCCSQPRPRPTGSWAARTCRSPSGCSAGRRRVVLVVSFVALGDAVAASRSSRSSTSGGCSACRWRSTWSAARWASSLFAVVVYAGFDGTAGGDREPRADGHLRPVLGRAPVSSACCSATSSGCSTRGGRSARGAAWMAKAVRGDLARAAGVPERARALAGGGRDPRLRLARARLRRPRRARDARDHGPRLRAASSCWGWALYGDRALVRSRRRVRRLLQPLRAALGVRARGQRAASCAGRSSAPPRARRDPGHRRDAAAS